jgi:hypothetical protein
MGWHRRAPLAFPGMDARDAALVIALGRVGIGATLLVSPVAINRGWVGDDAARPGARVLGRAVGARDLALGLGAVLALRGSSPARPWLVAGALADFGDLGATLGERRALPRSGLLGVGALAGGSALLGAWLARAVD